MGMLKITVFVLFVFLMIYQPIYSMIDSSHVSFCIDTSLFPMKISDLIENTSDVISIDYDDWGIKNANIYYNLPDYTFMDKRDGFIEIDPLFSDIPNLWRKSRFYINKINFNTLSAGYNGYLTTPITGFGYTKGDYSFLNVYGFASGSYYEKGIWGFEFSNISYDGRYNLYGSKYGRSIGESLNQNYRLITEFYPKGLILRSSIFYNKYMPGVSEYNMSTAYYDFAGSDKNYRVGGYVSLENPDSINGYKIGLLTSANIYRRRLGDIKMDGESSQYQILYNRNFRIFKQDMKININAMNYTFFSEGKYGRYEIRQSIQTWKNTKYFEFFIRGGLVNTNAVINSYISLNLSKYLKMKLNLSRDFYFYPLIYEVMKDTLSNYDLTKGFSVLDRGLELNFNSKYFASYAGLKFVSADFYLPFKNKPNIGYVGFNEISINEFFLRLQFDFKFENYVKLSNKVIIPVKNKSDRFLSFYANSSINGYFYLFKGNLKIYFSGGVWYLKGYDHVAWFEETNSIGIINFDVFNNDKLYISGEIGAKVSSFYIYYATYNLNGRLFSALPLMPYRNRLYTYGVKWWFID
ncbi:MAG: hypothetical protein H0Z29_03985 [Candidatus Marinimicrobia bacterium]|nr:hypothetical protein [Candidatus Neomarinimicrobiota bacterium]